ncbi:MAG TPA: 1-phosphofructokinase family hexose kinase [Chthonomonadales bacterium]|nr:1-phosphofructokinase family hexose kinase [Chthonomonadales bacterium]
MPHPIVTVTLNPSVDESTTVQRVLPEAKLRCTPQRYDPGGGGVNVARVLARLERPTLAVFPAGGVTGGLLDRLLDAEGVPNRAVTVAGDTRVNLHVDETETGAQYRFNMPGHTLAPDELEACLDAAIEEARGSRVLVASGSLPPGVPADAFARLARRAAAEGIRIALDTSGTALEEALMAGVWFVKPNRRELGEWARRPVSSVAEVVAAAREVLRAAGCDAVVVTLAQDGAVFVSAEGAGRVTIPPIRAVSRVGAGDSTVAGIVARLTEGASIAEAVRFGVACGAAAVMADGTQLCRPADVAAVLAAIPPVTVAE